jgi:hypothetical protein
MEFYPAREKFYGVRDTNHLKGNLKMKSFYKKIFYILTLVILNISNTYSQNYEVEVVITDVWWQTRENYGAWVRADIFHNGELVSPSDDFFYKWRAKFSHEGNYWRDFTEGNGEFEISAETLPGASIGLYVVTDVVNGTFINIQSPEIYPYVMSVLGANEATFSAFDENGQWMPSVFPKHYRYTIQQWKDGYRSWLTKNHEEGIKAAPDYVESSNKKFHHWFDDTKDIQNYTIYEMPNNDIDQSIEVEYNSASSASIGLNLTDVNSGGTIEFKDPWYADENDSRFDDVFGRRNKGMSGPFLVFAPPISINSTSDNKGVFLNQEPDPINSDFPYYSVRAKVQQEIEFHNELFTFNFLNWEHNTNALPTKPNQILSDPTTGVNYYQTPVVFTGDNGNITAVYKASQLSNTSSAYSNNGQRKLIETKLDGVTWLHQVYASDDHIWIEHSNDGGDTWILGNNGNPLDGSTNVAKNPSIAFTYQNWGSGDEVYYIGIVWQEKYGSKYKIKGKMCNQMSGGDGIPDLYSSAMTLYTEASETYSGYNANPNLCLDDGWAGPYLFTIEKKYTSGSYPAGINWFVGHIQGGSGQYDTYFNPPEDHDIITGTNSNSTKVQLCLDEYRYNTICANFIYQQGNYSGGIYSGSLYFFYYYSNWYLNEYNDGLISYPYANISPSIVTLQNPLYAACWIEYETLTYYLFNASSLTYFDSGAKSASINRGGLPNSGFIAWSKQNYSGTWYNKSMRFDNGYPVTSSTRTLNTSGKYIQLGNGADIDLSSMHVSSFYPFSSPYYFKTSNAMTPLPKVNSNIITGRGFMILNDEATFSYRLEGLNVDGKNINFVEVSDTMNFGKLGNLNNALITEPFQLNDNSVVVFTEQSGFADSLSASKKLAKNDYIRYKIELIENATGKKLGTIKDKSINASNTSAFKMNSFKLNTKGLTAKSVCAKITVESNCIKEISSKINIKGDIPTEINRNRPVKRSNLLLIKSYLEENEALAKYAIEGLAITDLEIPQSYALKQNFPNPFNPVTTIQYSLPEDTHITLIVYNVNGQMIGELVNDFKTAGSYTITFDGKALASGVYFYKMQAGKFTDVKRMLLIK